MFTFKFGVAVFILAVSTVFAQVSGRLTGTVVDPSGASIPNAKVSLYLPEGKTALLTTTTNSDGIFDFIAVRPALYHLEIESPGFAKHTEAEIKVDPAREILLPPIKMALAAAAVTVDVSTSGTILDAATAEISTTVTQSQITNLPVLNRQVVNLFNTQAGVTQNTRQATVINGMRPSFSNITFDGILVQDTVRTNDLDLIPNRLTIAQVAEFTVSTTNASPTLGGGASTIVLIPPSGTNLLHGSAYWFNRNNYFSANDWFNNRNGISRPALNLNEIGATIGGPIIKDKLFYFGVYEAYRLKRQTPKTFTIPTPAARQGILQYRSGGSILQFDTLKTFNLQASAFIAQNILSLVPTVGNNNAVGDGLNTTGYSFNSRNNVTRDNVTGKVDYSLSARHAFAGSYSWNRDVPDRTIDGNGTTTGGYFTVIPPTFNDNRIKLASVSWRWSPTATLTNELRGGLNYNYVPFSVRQKAPPYYVANFFFTSPYETAEVGEGRNVHQYNIQDNAQWVRGKHTISFGIQSSLLRSHSWNYNGNAVTNGVTPVYTIGLASNSPYGFRAGDIPGASSTDITTANNILASIAGLINTAGQLFNVTSRTSGFVPGAPSIQNQAWDQYAFYALDNIKLSRRLTLTLGLRWDYFAPVDETDGLAIAPRLVNGNGPATLLGNATLDFAGTSAGNPFYKKDWN
ncbi:MAG TPA: carboxypeptidase regulatory-like domain-containing protein, partial [Bryobacteraceae bacterium]